MVEMEKILRNIVGTALMSLLPYNAMAAIPAQYNTDVPKKEVSPKPAIIGRQQITLDNQLIFYLLQVDRNNDRIPDMEILVSPCNPKESYVITDYFTGMVHIDVDLDGDPDIIGPIHPAMFEYIVDNRPQC